MKPIYFKEQNIVYAKDQKEYIPLPAHKTEDGDVITCWELSKEEIAHINEHGTLWLSIKTFNNPLQPIYLTTTKAELI